MIVGKPIDSPPRPSGPHNVLGTVRSDGSVSRFYSHSIKDIIEASSMYASPYYKHISYKVGNLTPSMCALFGFNQFVATLLIQH